jgi:predicted small secreted protein
MWVILAINVLFLVWLISALGSSSTCDGMTRDQLSGCQTVEGIGKGIVFFVILLLWALVDVILGVVFLVTRRNN